MWYWLGLDICLWYYTSIHFWCIFSLNDSFCDFPFLLLTLGLKPLWISNQLSAKAFISNHSNSQTFVAGGPVSPWKYLSFTSCFLHQHTVLSVSAFPPCVSILASLICHPIPSPSCFHFIFLLSLLLLFLGAFLDLSINLVLNCIDFVEEVVFILL